MPIIEVCWCNNNDRGATITISWLPCCLSLTILRFRHILRKYTYSIVQKFLNSSIYQHLLVALSYPNQWNQVLLLLYLFKKKIVFLWEIQWFCWFLLVLFLLRRNCWDRVPFLHRCSWFDSPDSKGGFEVYRGNYGVKQA